MILRARFQGGRGDETGAPPDRLSPDRGRGRGLGYRLPPARGTARRTTREDDAIAEPEPEHPEDDDGRVAHAIAHAAGAALLALRESPQHAAGGRALGDEGDRRSHALILERLRALRPGDAVLSEEAADDRERLARRRVWIVDPLDGTREYSEPPRDDWAVHVALCVDGRPVAGAVALPAQGRTLGTAAPPPPPPGPAHRPLRIAVSRTRPPAVATAVAAGLGAELVPMGSAGAKAMAVVAGSVDAYLHAGGQYEWDSAAPVAVALAAGCHASRIDGAELRFNSADPYLPDLLVCRPELAAGLLEAIARASAGPRGS